MCEITCLLPREVRTEDEALFRRTVEVAGEVDPATFPALYQRARSVCFARVGGGLAGVGALKRPFKSHRAKVFRYAKTKLDPELFTYELGWFHVLDGFKGRHISSGMVRSLMAQVDGASVYATSRIDNAPMHAALRGHGDFLREGYEYPSELGDTPMCLFVRHNQAA